MNSERTDCQNVVALRTKVAQVDEYEHGRLHSLHARYASATWGKDDVYLQHDWAEFMLKQKEVQLTVD